MPIATPATSAIALPANGRLPSRSVSRTAIGIGVSLLVHAVLLFGVLHNKPVIEGGPILPEQSPITLLLPPTPIPSPQPQAITVPLPETKPTPPARPKKSLAAKPKPRLVKPEPAPREMVAAADPAPSAPVQPAPVPLPNPVPEAAPAADMSTMIAAARERRRAAAEASAAPAESASAGNEIALANIQHSLRTQSRRRDGTSGIFQILDKGVQTARFSFHGWTPGSSREISQLFEVDAGLQGDVDRAIVRKMIELIRKHYPGDFNWDSHRLGRVVVLSARLGDNAALESFLLREFFSGRG